MSFSKTLLKGGLGAVVALAIYSVATCYFLFGAIELTSLVVNTLIGASIFGLLYAVVHLGLKPTLLSSLLTGFAFVTIVTAVSIFLAGATAVTWSVAELLVLAAGATLIGLGAYIGSRTGR